MPSKTVVFYPVVSFAQRANPELAMDYFADSKRSIGSYFKGKKPGSGLSIEEENFLLRNIIGLDPSDRDYKKERDNYYADISTKIPISGLKLEIGLSKSNEAPVSIENFPLDLDDYMAYRHAIGHPTDVAPTKEDSIGNPITKFYLDDPEATNIKELEIFTNQKEAIAKYLQIENDTASVNMYLTNFNIDVSKIREDKRSYKLKELVENEPLKFIKMVADPNIKPKYQILSCIQTNILKRVGTRILVTESSEEIGRDMEEAVQYWKDDINSAQVNLIKARYKEFAKKKQLTNSDDEQD